MRRSLLLANSTDIADAVAHQRGEQRWCPTSCFAHTTALSCEYIGLSRDFLPDRAAAAAEKRRLPPQDSRAIKKFVIRSSLALFI
jgi:hypothetical protein